MTADSGCTAQFPGQRGKQLSLHTGGFNTQSVGDTRSGNMWSLSRGRDVIQVTEAGS